MMRSVAPAILAGAVLAASPQAWAQDPVRAHPRLWATVNVCDTQRYPDVIGIRASMPVVNRRDVRHMRFQVQYRTASGTWELIPQGADSGWVRVAEADAKAVESGYNFRFDPPADGRRFVLRGLVTFRWMREGRVVRRIAEVTERGHRSTRGADPKDYSAATCEIS
jgi:hypothetical protein